MSYIRNNDRSRNVFTICPTCRGRCRPLYADEPCSTCHGNGNLKNGKPYVAEPSIFGKAVTDQAIDDGMREALEEHYNERDVPVDMAVVDGMVAREPTLSKVFADFELRVIPEEATMVQRREMRRAWYAGVQYVISMMEDGLTSCEDERIDTAEHEAAEIAVYKRMRDELDAFVEKVKRGDA